LFFSPCGFTSPLPSAAPLPPQQHGSDRTPFAAPPLLPLSVATTPDWNKFQKATSSLDRAHPFCRLLFVSNTVCSSLFVLAASFSLPPHRFASHRPASAPLWPSGPLLFLKSYGSLLTSFPQPSHPFSSVFRPRFYSCSNLTSIPSSYGRSALRSSRSSSIEVVSSPSFLAGTFPDRAASPPHLSRFSTVPLKVDSLILAGLFSRSQTTPSSPPQLCVRCPRFDFPPAASFASLGEWCDFNIVPSFSLSLGSLSPSPVPCIPTYCFPSPPLPETTFFPDDSFFPRGQSSFLLFRPLTLSFLVDQFLILRSASRPRRG